jgi:hypothetical protein
MADDFNSVFRDVYSVRLDHPTNVDVRTIPGSASQMQLVLAIQVPVKFSARPRNASTGSHSGNSSA